MFSNFKIHFVHNIDVRNTGDMNCAPYLYFAPFFSNYICEFHNIGEVDIRSIDETDWVIVGGGGLFDQCDGWNRDINLILNKCRNVVSWGCGHNSHCSHKISEKIEYEKFKIIATRDFGYNYCSNEVYVPCVSCLNSKLSQKYSIKRTIGVIEHKEFPICEFNYDRINNTCSIDTIIHFIGSSNVIITNTYHAAYWSMLMGKKTILYNQFSTKFNYFEYKPVIYSGNLERDIESAKIYPEYMEKCRTLNNQFFDSIVEQIRLFIYKKKDDTFDEAGTYLAIRNVIKTLHGKRVVICGTGIHTNMLKPLLDQENINIVAFTGKVKGDVLFGRECRFVPEAELNQIEYDVVLLSSYIYRNEMKKDLEIIAPNKIFDIYEELRKRSTYIEKEFFYMNRININNDEV